MLFKRSLRMQRGVSRSVPVLGGVALGATSLAAIVGAAGIGVSAANAGPGEPQWPSRVTAIYKVAFNGFDIGSFRFQTAIGPQGYTADGNAELSALLGAFTWRGITRVAGSLDGQPHPAGYSFDFRSSSRAGSVKLGFRQDNVTNVSMVPPAEDDSEQVPVREQHLKGVLDPLSAVLALARVPAGGDPCARKLSIFDGKQRFDLVLSHRRHERIAEARPSGQPDTVHVCRVRFVPIAGHKRNDDTRNLAEQTGIEVALRPVPSADIYVPHQITVPTGIGAAVLTAQRIEIQSPAYGAIALTD